MIHFWQEEDYKAIHDAKNFADLFPIAMRVIDRMPQPIVMVAAPISTGGKGSMEANRHFLSAAIDLLYDKGVNVFDQNPFEDKMQELKTKCTHDGYCVELLHDTYKPIYESGKINAMYFLQGWQTSIGAKWERQECKRLGIKIIDFPPNLLKELR